MINCIKQILKVIYRCTFKLSQSISSNIKLNNYSLLNRLFFANTDKYLMFNILVEYGFKIEYRKFWKMNSDNCI